MALLKIATSQMHAAVSTVGGSLLRLDAVRGGDHIHILRPAPLDESLPALRAACFPLVPFGNRVRGNTFEREGKRYTLRPNQPWDEHYLHGDGWLGQWQVEHHDGTSVSLSFEHEADASSPYSYHATQQFRLEEHAITMELAVINRGETLPFGLGWHPYFVLDADTRLQAAAKSYWTEREHYLPGEEGPLPEELNFNTPRALPRHWVNNGFAGWDGEARIVWPAKDLQVTMHSPDAHYYFVFVSDTRFDPEYRHDFFCFEPMTHAADTHDASTPRGLVELPRNEQLRLTIRFETSRARD
jgi:aldose 1-epimerase